MDEERLVSLRDLEERLDYRFKDIGWLDKALTHKSFIHQSNTVQNPALDKAANEVLEFLGDAVLNLAVSHLLFQQFPEAHEGTLSQKRSHLVKQASLSSLSRKLQLEPFLLLGKSELLDGGRKKSSILANTYEAVLGAVYMDAGFDPALEMVQRHLETYFPSGTTSLHSDDYKSLLQELTQRTLGISPDYHVLEEFGPDHDKRFQVSLTVSEKVKVVGWGKSKKKAEQEAAKKALEEISTKIQAPSVNDQTPNEL
jgi:ribonuclease III